MTTLKFGDIITKYEDAQTSGDIADWLERLELVAQIQKITELTAFLPLFLHGPAFAVYKQLDDDQKKDYEKLKAAMIQAFGVNCYAAYDQLQRRVLLEGETVDVYLSELRKLVSLMGQKEPEPLLRCAFMAGLPFDISIQLKSMAAVETLTLNELVVRARMMISSKTGDQACAVGYNASRAKLNGGCYRCGSNSHLIRDCSLNKGGPRNAKPNHKPRTCYTCGDPTHIAKYCPLRSAQGQPGNAEGGASAPDVPLSHQ